jgi:hypothetical protein
MLGPDFAVEWCCDTQIGLPCCMSNHLSLVPVLTCHAVVEQRGTTELIAVVETGIDLGSAVVTL